MATWCCLISWPLNPPFSLDKWGHDEAENDKFGRFRRGVPPKTKGDYALSRIWSKNPETGNWPYGRSCATRCAFRGSSEGKIRQKTDRRNLLDAVIGLPEKKNCSTVRGFRLRFLIFKKQKVDDKVLFIDASREFKAGKNQNQLSAENIEKSFKTYRDGDNVEKYAYLASLKEIQDNDYNLNIPRYVDYFRGRRRDWFTGRCVLNVSNWRWNWRIWETEMAGYLKELGYGA